MVTTEKLLQKQLLNLLHQHHLFALKVNFNIWMKIIFTVSAFFFIISKWKVFTHRCTAGTRCSSRTSRTRFTLWRDSVSNTISEVQSVQHEARWRETKKYFCLMVFKFSLTLTFSPLGPPGPGGPMGPVRPWDGKKRKNGAEIIFKFAGATHEKTLYSAATTTTTKQKWESLTRAPSLPGAPSGPFSPRSP